MPNRWLVATAVIVAPVVAVFALILWQTPFPISDGIALIEDVWDPWSLDFFLPGRYYYRPLLFLSISLSWHASGSPATFVALQRLLMIAPIAILVALFLVRLRPRSAADAAAAVLAAAVLLGSAAFLDNAEIPLTPTAVGMPLLLAAWMLAERAPVRGSTLIFVAIALVAIGYKEQGLVILPVVIAAWWMRAPGVSRTTAAAMFAVGVVYVVFRVTTGRQWAPFEQEIGFGFSVLQANEAAARFGAFPIVAYAYNAGATMLNLLLAEPTAGVFSITRAIVRGEALPWQYVHLASSAGLTALIVWWAGRTLSTVRAEGWSEESRTAVVLAVALAASGPLSFNYSRDRLGGMALVPYAVAAFYAVRAVFATMARAGAVRTAATTLALVLLMTAWQTRVQHMLDGARERAGDTHREWITNLYERRAEFAGRPIYLRLLDELAPQGRVRPAEPLRYPAWIRDLLGRT